MKSKNYVITYLSALVTGILLLIFHDDSELYASLVRAIGALIAIPSLVLLCTMLFGKKKEGAYNGVVVVAAEIAAVVGIAFGIWLLVSPGMFIKALIYVLGALLIAVGIAQISFVHTQAKPSSAAPGWFVVPSLTLIAGVVLIILGPEKVASMAGLITGIVLVVYAANGFASAGREAKLRHDVENSMARAEEIVAGEAEEKASEAATEEKRTEKEAEKASGKKDLPAASEPAEDR